MRKFLTFIVALCVALIAVLAAPPGVMAFDDLLTFEVSTLTLDMTQHTDITAFLVDVRMDDLTMPVGVPVPDGSTFALKHTQWAAPSLPHFDEKDWSKTTTRLGLTATKLGGASHRPPNAVA